MELQFTDDSLAVELCDESARARKLHLSNAWTYSANVLFTFHATTRAVVRVCRLKY